ncbi:hypothetical protein BJ138DRAFT_1014489 [Hygrophoropsis aurantiaca]|uniref:Uncharacterized protein n=1 Tax=Hygrophoropsis aurantiaca TaxID=72124 RepID=A0ACB8A2B3_9AGAM|nr:hypothetical protein BJ138DRAFT_1014489 [Hygrophoropsis aurantiaca]
MRGVSMPTHQYARFAESYLQPKTINQGEPPIKPDIDSLALTTRAYTRVLLRLRAQAESEARYLTRLAATQTPSTSPSRPATRNSHRQAVRSRASSRAPSPSSSYSHSYSHHGAGTRSRAPSPSEMITFRSPLFRPHRAPLLRVFVPSSEGEWLSDASVMECEAELKRSGVMKLLRVGDVVWDIAVGDEGNAGRMVWDGSYLVDLDYKFSRMGELPPYFHNLAFSPSYFHRVLRTGVSGSGGGNPIVYIDLSPWGEELATNLQLLQDRARAETPHGTLHNVVRWVHRSSFTIRPPSQLPHSHIHTRSHALRLPIPNVEGFFIDPGWYGTVIIEAEGTNEGLADLQERCGPGAFPPRAEAVSSKLRNAKEKANQRVFRILREKSRPGEIWIRTVREKERVI